jgi:hypothetical protein
MRAIYAVIATVIRLQWDQDLLARACASWQTRGANQTIKHTTTYALVRMSAHTNDKSTEARIRRFPDAESIVHAAAYHGGAVGRRGHRSDPAGVS